jgi:hypothetical protein
MMDPLRDDPRTLQNINDQVRSLPNCPSCGYLTRLDKITVRLVGKGRFVAYVLRCVHSITAGRPEGSPQCTFVVPMTPEP